MVLISNTGPLIALAKIGMLHLLPKLGWEAILVPPAVKRELWAKSGPDSSSIDSALESFLKVKEPGQTNQQVESAASRLDEGEKQVVCLGAASREATLLLDDKAGRTVAKSLGLGVTGTVGLLLIAKRRGLIQKVLPLLEEMRARGYWISDAVLDTAAQLSAEL